MRAWLAVLLVLPALPFTTGATDADRCGDVPGVGFACRVEGGYEVALADGTVVFTHGPDALPGDALVASALAPARAPPCVADPLRDYHSHFIYAHPVDKPNRGAQLRDQLRGLVAEANGLLHLEGAELGAPVEYRFRCDADGLPTISVETIPVPIGAGSYQVLVNALTALGYANGHAKYWVWYDDTSACPCGGIAAAPLDPERAPANTANSGPYFGATYGYMSARIPMHENGHNLGVVNNNAPDTSGAGHCNDGSDIMCYADGGPRSIYVGNVCSDRMRFDCGHDTYFHPKPPPNTFVANRWQIAAPIDRFVQGCAYLEGDILGVGAVLGTATVPVPETCAGHRYAIYGRMYAEPAHAATKQPPLRVYANTFSLCWHAGALPLSCPANAAPWGHEGVVPNGATHAVITRLTGEDPRYTLSVI